MRGVDVITEKFEASLRQAIGRNVSEIEVPPGLADRLKAREYRIGRSHRGLVVGAAVAAAVAAIGLPLHLAIGPASLVGRAHHARVPVELQLASYRLRLPGGYNVSGGRSAACVVEVQASAPVSPTPLRPTSSPLAPAQPRIAQATSSAGGCVLMLLTPPFRPRSKVADGDPNVPLGAEEVTVGTYHAWLMPPGYWQPYSSDGKPVEENGLVIESPAGDGEIRDLVIGCTGLSCARFVSLVATGLSSG